MSRVVKRYGNRKLYDTTESRYVTLEDIASLVKVGEELRVVDNDSGEDLTAVTYAQIILEEERKKSGFLPLPILRNLIQQGEEALQDFASRVDKGTEAIRSFGEKARGRVHDIVGSGSKPAASKGLIDDLVSSSQKRIEGIQREIDDRVKASVDRLTSIPGVQALQKEISRIEKSVRRVEERLATLRKDAATRSATREEEPPPRGDDDDDSPGSSTASGGTASGGGGTS